MIENTKIRQQVSEALWFRHATKVFDPKREISEEDFNCILEAGRLSPSSLGLEPWKFLVIKNEALKKELRKVSWGAENQLPTASHFVIILARTEQDTRYDKDYFEDQMIKVRGFEPDFFKEKVKQYQSFQEKDLELLENERTMFDWACKQTYIALANMMTTAALLGIDSCPIEGFDFKQVQAILNQHNLTEEGRLGISVMAAFGYREKDPSRPKTRRDMSDIVQWVD